MSLPIGIGPQFSHGFSSTIVFSAANPAADATTAATLPQGNGYLVPPGFNAHIVGITASANEAITDESVQIVLRSNGTALANMPVVVLSPAAQRDGALPYFGGIICPGGTVLDAAVIAPVGYLPVTADYDVCAHIVLVQQ